MVAATVNRTITVTLTIPEEAAVWLKGVMQNPLGHQASAHAHVPESPYCASMRMAFFNALKNQDIRG